MSNLRSGLESLVEEDLRFLSDSEVETRLSEIARAEAVLYAERSRTLAEVERQVDGPSTHAEVDRVHVLEQDRRRLRAALTGARGERADVLGQAAAAEPDPGVQAPAPDPPVVAEDVRQRDHVRPRSVADLRHRVDE